MRTRVKGTLVGVALVASFAIALAGIGAYFVIGNLEKRDASEVQAVQEMDAVRARFGARPPLVEIIDVRVADVRINRLQNRNGVPVTTLHIINWNPESRALAQTQVPLWLMRFSSVNLLSQLGVGPARLRLTVDDIRRYGPGIVVDYGRPGTFRLMVWAD